MTTNETPIIVSMHHTVQSIANKSDSQEALPDAYQWILGSVPQKLLHVVAQQLRSQHATISGTDRCMQQACHVINCESWALLLTMKVLHCTMSTLLSAVFIVSVRF